MIEENLAAGRSVTIAAAVCASWARYAEGVGENGEQWDIVDLSADLVRSLATAQNEGNPAAFTKNTAVFAELAQDSRFRDPYLRTLKSLHEVGVAATLSHLVGRDIA